MRRLAGAAAEAGVEIREHDRVEALDAVEAETIVVATDGYPSGLLGELEGLIIPARGQMVATEPLPERLFPLPHYARHGHDYWHQLPDGRLIVGGFRDADMAAESTATRRRHRASRGRSTRSSRRCSGAALEITHRWSGVFGLVPRLAAARRAASRARAGSGPPAATPVTATCSGSMCGELVAQAITGDAASDPRRVRRRPGSSA